MNYDAFVAMILRSMLPSFKLSNKKCSPYLP